MAYRYHRQKQQDNQKRNFSNAAEFHYKMTFVNGVEFVIYILVKWDGKTGFFLIVRFACAVVLILVLIT